MKRTQAELAEILGVSRVTVNKALRGHPSVQAQTRERIVQLAEELGYRPSAAARAMRSGRTGIVSMLLAAGQSRYYLPHTMLKGIHDGLVQRDMQLSLAELPDEKVTSEGYLPKILRELSCDGLLLNYIADVPPSMAEMIRRFHIPSIFLNNKLEADCVYPDDVEGARKATEDLIKMGHRRIAYMWYGFSTHYSYGDRRAGYTQAMHAAGLEPRLLGAPERLTVAQIIHDIRGWLSRPDRPTAVLSYEYKDASTVFCTALGMGMKVPGDLSVAAISHYTADETGVPLRVWRIPFFQLGQVAIDMVLHKIDHPKEALPPEPVPFLVCEEGASAGAPG